MPTVFAMALAILCLPALAAAQDNRGIWNGRDDRNNRNYRSNLRNSIRRVESLSRSFERSIDRALDRSRLDGRNREDRINETAEQFREAAERLEDRYDDRSDYNRSANEARRLLQLGSNINRFMMRSRLADSRLVSEWSQIRRELYTIAQAYGYNTSEFNDGYIRRNDRRNNGNYDMRDERWGTFPE